MRPGLAVGPATLAACLALLLPADSDAQQVEGRVVDADDGSPVGGATITLADPAGTPLRRVVADDRGHFWLWHTEAGRFLLSAQRIGYAQVSGQPVQVDSAEVVQVLIRMRPEAVPVEPLRVVARREVKRFTPDEFYDRMSRFADRGTFITREEIELSGARLPSLAVSRAPGTWVRPAGRSGFTNSISLASYGRLCSPAIYLDGRRLQPWETLDEVVMVDRLEGIEVYRGYFRPGTYFQDLENWGCGYVLAWTKRDPDPRYAFSWKRTIMFGVIGGLLFGITSLF